jgi:hypothetical protein
MRIRVLVFLLVAISAPLTLSLIRGQEREVPLPTIISGTSGTSSLPPNGEPIQPASYTAPAGATRPTPQGRDLSHLTPLQQQMVLTAQRGADWMFRMHGVKGRFVPGYLPALKQEMEGDHFLRQAGAAYALARSACFSGEERYAVRATQAILALLDDTVTDSTDATSRHTGMPPIVVNRLASASVLVLAVCALPAPQKDMLEQAEQLCNHIRKQAQASGALGFADKDDEEAQSYPGLALHALLLSHKHRSAAWKLDLARKALPYYRAWWKDHKSLSFAPTQVAACSEAYLATREKDFADFAFEMADWLCGMQYTQIEPKRMLWYGGFMTCHDGRAVETPPTVDSARCAEGLVEACRIARELGDVVRHQRYTDALERCLQFLATLQYTDAGTQHFAEWYRPRIVGAFHPSHQDGNLRIDYTQHAVTALYGYLEQVAR